MPDNKKPAQVPVDSELEAMLDIALAAFNDIEHNDHHDRTGYSIGNIRWLLKKFAASRQLTDTQREKVSQIVTRWHEVMFPQKKEKKNDAEH